MPLNKTLISFFTQKATPRKKGKLENNTIRDLSWSFLVLHSKRNRNRTNSSVRKASRYDNLDNWSLVTNTYLHKEQGSVSSIHSTSKFTVASTLRTNQSSVEMQPNAEPWSKFLAEWMWTVQHQKTPGHRRQLVFHHLNVKSVSKSLWLSSIWNWMCKCAKLHAIEKPTIQTFGFANNNKMFPCKINCTEFNIPLQWTSRMMANCQQQQSKHLQCATHWCITVAMAISKSNILHDQSIIADQLQCDCVIMNLHFSFGKESKTLICFWRWNHCLLRAHKHMHMNEKCLHSIAFHLFGHWAFDCMQKSYFIWFGSRLLWHWNSIFLIHFLHLHTLQTITWKSFVETFESLTELCIALHHPLKCHCGVLQSGLLKPMIWFLVGTQTTTIPQWGCSIQFLIP